VFKLSDFLKTERNVKTVYPPAHEVWAWTRLPVEDIKVVILGQDPYHGKGQAHGI
jgi:uracil-DNA glycosylase